MRNSKTKNGNRRWDLASASSSLALPELVASEGDSFVSHDDDDDCCELEEEENVFSLPTGNA